MPVEVSDVRFSLLPGAPFGLEQPRLFDPHRDQVGDGFGQLDVSRRKVAGRSNRVAADCADDLLADNQGHDEDGLNTPLDHHLAHTGQQRIMLRAGDGQRFFGRHDLFHREIALHGQFNPRGRRAAGRRVFGHDRQMAVGLVEERQAGLVHLQDARQSIYARLPERPSIPAAS